MQIGFRFSPSSDTTERAQMPAIFFTAVFSDESSSSNFKVSGFWFQTYGPSDPAHWQKKSKIIEEVRIDFMDVSLFLFMAANVGFTRRKVTLRSTLQIIKPTRGTLCAEGTCRRAQNALLCRARRQSRCPRPSTRGAAESQRAQLVNLVVWSARFNQLPL